MSTPRLELVTQEQNKKQWDEGAEHRFLSELTALSQKYRFGIGGDALVFMMEWDDDGRVYTCDSESRLFFR